MSKAIKFATRLGNAPINDLLSGAPGVPHGITSWVNRKINSNAHVWLMGQQLNLMPNNLRKRMEGGYDYLGKPKSNWSGL